MSRINDVGGMEGFGPIDTADEEPGFAADWEARVWALNVTLIGQGRYTVDEFRDAIERMPPDEYLAASYYERWLAAITTLLVDKGLVAAHDLAEALAAPDA
jgi:nitrile hydratase subunit beta